MSILRGLVPNSGVISPGGFKNLHDALLYVMAIPYIHHSCTYNAATSSTDAYLCKYHTYMSILRGLVPNSGVSFPADLKIFTVPL